MTNPNVFLVIRFYNLKYEYDLFFFTKAKWVLQGIFLYYTRFLYLLLEVAWNILINVKLMYHKNYSSTKRTLHLEFYGVI